MGATRFVYLDENAGKTVAPYMSQQLETGSDFIGADKDIPEDEVECKLPLEEMRMLKDEQEELDSRSPEAEAIVPAVTPADLLNNICYVDPHTPGLIAYWRFCGTDQQEDGSILDQTGHGYNAVAKNGTPSWVPNHKCPY